MKRMQVRLRYMPAIGRQKEVTKPEDMPLKHEITAPRENSCELENCLRKKVSSDDETGVQEPRSTTKARSPSLITLPKDVFLLILDILPPESAIALALTTKSTFLRYQPTLDELSRSSFLLSFERDVAGMIYCLKCDILHGADDEFRPCTRREASLNCTMLFPSPNITAHLRMAMKLHRQGQAAKAQEHLDQLSGRQLDFSRKYNPGLYYPYFSSCKSVAKITGGSLLVHTDQVLRFEHNNVPDAPELETILTGIYWNINYQNMDTCSGHLCTVHSASQLDILRLFPSDLCRHEFAIRGVHDTTIRNCGCINCLTPCRRKKDNFKLEWRYVQQDKPNSTARWGDSDRDIEVRVMAWWDFGTCEDPWEEGWRGQFDVDYREICAGCVSEWGFCKSGRVLGDGLHKSELNELEHEECYGFDREGVRVRFKNAVEEESSSLLEMAAQSNLKERDASRTLRRRGSRFLEIFRG